MARWSWTAVAVVASLAGFPVTAGAQSSEAERNVARDLGNSGIALYDQGQDVYYVAPEKVPEVEPSDSRETDFDSGKDS